MICRISLKIASLFRPGPAVLTSSPFSLTYARSWARVESAFTNPSVALHTSADRLALTALGVECTMVRRRAAALNGLSTAARCRDPHMLRPAAARRWTATRRAERRPNARMLRRCRATAARDLPIAGCHVGPQGFTPVGPSRTRARRDGGKLAAKARIPALRACVPEPCTPSRAEAPLPPLRTRGPNVCRRTQDCTP